MRVQPYAIETITRAHEDHILEVAFCPEHKLFATCCSDSTARIWDWETRQLVNTLQYHTASVTCIRWNDHIGRWITGSDDRTLRTWKCDGAVVEVPGIADFINCPDAVSTLCIDETYGMAVVALVDRTICVIDAEKAEIIMVMSGHTDSIRSIVHIPKVR